MWPFKKRESEPKKQEFDYAAIRIGNVYILPPDEEDIAFFRERVAEQRRKKRQQKMRLLTRRSLLVGGAAAAVGLIALPFLPKGEELNPEDLLRPGLAQANPHLMRRLCLEFYEHPEGCLPWGGRDTHGGVRGCSGSERDVLSIRTRVGCRRETNARQVADPARRPFDFREARSGLLGESRSAGDHRSVGELLGPTGARHRDTGRTAVA